MVAVGYRAEIRIDVADQLRKIEWKLPIGFNGTDAEGEDNPRLETPWIVPVPSDDDDVVRADEARDVVPPNDPGIVAASAARRLVGPLLQPGKK